MAGSVATKRVALLGDRNIEDLTNAIHRTGLEGNVFDTSLGETLNELSDIFGRWNTDSNKILQRGDPHDASLAREEVGRRIGEG